jgi:hypothetical protein
MHCFHLCSLDEASHEVHIPSLVFLLNYMVKLSNVPYQNLQVGSSVQSIKSSNVYSLDDHGGNNSSFASNQKV